MTKLQTDLVLFVNKLYDQIPYKIPYTLELKEFKNSEYLSFKVKSGNSYSENDHDMVINQILNSQYKESISEFYTHETGRHYEIWLYDVKIMREKKIKKLM